MINLTFVHLLAFKIQHAYGDDIITPKDAPFPVIPPELPPVSAISNASLICQTLNVNCIHQIYADLNDRCMSTGTWLLGDNIVGLSPNS